jgi:hypothetical protein
VRLKDDPRILWRRPELDLELDCRNTRVNFGSKAWNGKAEEIRHVFAGVAIKRRALLPSCVAGLHSHELPLQHLATRSPLSPEYNTTICLTAQS